MALLERQMLLYTHSLQGSNSGACTPLDVLMARIDQPVATLAYFDLTSFGFLMISFGSLKTRLVALLAFGGVLFVLFQTWTYNILPLQRSCIYLRKSVYPFSVIMILKD